MLFDCQSVVLHLCVITNNSIGLSSAYINQGCFRRSSCSHAGAECFGAYVAVDAVWKTASVPLSESALLLLLSSAHVPHDPRVVFFWAHVPFVFLYTAVTAHGALTFSLPHNHITTPPHVVYTSTSDVASVLLKLHAATSTFLCTAILPCFHISDCRYTAASPSLFLCCQSAMLSQFHTPVFH